MLLGVLFTVVATFYASVGFGGGSSYLALLVLWGLPFAVIPCDCINLQYIGCVGQ